MNVVRIGQNVSLSCFTKNTSADITYSLFWGTKYLESKKRRGGAVDFYLRISSANKTGPYKCKTTVSNLWKYSQDFNFTIAGKRICIQWRRGSHWDPLLWCEGPLEGESIRLGRAWFICLAQLPYAFSFFFFLIFSFFLFLIWANSLKDGTPSAERILPA